MALFGVRSRFEWNPAIPPEEPTKSDTTKMNTTAPVPVATPGKTAAIQKKVFRVTLTTDPKLLAAIPAKFIEILLGPGMSPHATADLSSFVFSGGGKVVKHSMNHGVTGDFSSTLSMRCWPETSAPQVIGQMTGNLTQITFILALDTSCTVNDWFTVSLIDERGNWFPTTAHGRPGLIGRVSWNTDGVFTPVGYQGNGMIDGLSDAGFKATILPL